VLNRPDIAGPAHRATDGLVAPGWRSLDQARAPGPHRNSPPHDDQVAVLAIGRLLLTPTEAADRLSISRTKVYELMAAGVLRSIHIGRLRRVPVDALRDFIGEMESR